MVRRSIFFQIIFFCQDIEPEYIADNDNKQKEKKTNQEWLWFNNFGNGESNFWDGPKRINRYNCPLCLAGYKRASDLRNHFSVKHFEQLEQFPIYKTEGKYKCGFCGQCFAREKTLGVHERIHVNKIKNVRSAVNYGEISFKMFEPKRDLTRVPYNGVIKKRNNNTNTTIRIRPIRQLTKFSINFIIN